MVLLHGRGAAETDLAPLRRFFPDDAFMVYPRAPFAAAPWGYGPGWAWYRFLSGTRPEPETFEQAQRLLAAFLEQLPGSLPVPPGPLVVGGFSQGGTMGLAYALRNPGSARLVVNLSGFLADHPSVEAARRQAGGLAVFWGHGTEDGNIPHRLADEGRKALKDAGADVTAFDAPMGHTISLEELAALRTWLETRLGPTP